MSLRDAVMAKWTKDSLNSDADIENILSSQKPELSDALNELKNQRDQEEMTL